MIELIPELPDDTVGVKLSGKVEATDYNQTLDPAIEAALKVHKKINALVVFDAGVDYTAGAAWQDTRLGLRHPLSWKRVALVAEHRWWDHVIPAVSAVMPGEVKSFLPAELEAAKTWLAAAGE